MGSSQGQLLIRYMLVRILAVVFSSLVLADSPRLQGPPTPLTPAQRTAVREALRKLWNYAFEEWHAEDKRWEALEEAEATHQESNGSQHCNLPMGGGDVALTEPKDRKLSSKVANDVYLNANLWKGANQARWQGLDDPAGCWALAAALLHEGDHQDDDYPWPPATPADKKKHICEEQKAAAKELEVLLDALDRMTEEEAKLLEDELKRARAQVARRNREKEQF